MKKQTGLARFFKHSMIYAIGNIINRIGAFILLPVYTGYLSVSEYGTLELFYAVSAVVSGILSIGIAHATLRYYFEYEDERERHEVVTTNIIASFGISLIGGSVVLIFADSIMSMLFDEAHYRWALYIVMATMILELSSQVGLAYIRAKEYSLLFVAIALLKLIVQICVNIYLVIYLSKGVEGVLFGNMLAVFLGWIVICGLVLKECHFSFSRKKMFDVMGYCAPLLLSTLVALVGSNADRFIINEMLDLHHLGLYALAVKFALLIEALIGEPFSRSYGAYRFSIMKMEEAADIQAKIVKYLTVVLGVITVSIVYFAPDVVHLMSKPEYSDIDKYLLIVCLAIAMRVINYPLQTGILYAKKTSLFIKINTIEAIVALSLNLILIPVIGLYGACIAKLTSLLLGNGITHIASSKYFKVRYNYFQLFVLAIIVAMFSGIYYFTLNISFWPALIIKILSLIIMICVIYLSPVFLKKERDTIEKYLLERLVPKPAI